MDRKDPRKRRERRYRRVPGAFPGLARGSPHSTKFTWWQYTPLALQAQGWVGLISDTAYSRILGIVLASIPKRPSSQRLRGYSLAATAHIRWTPHVEPRSS